MENISREKNRRIFCVSVSGKALWIICSEITVPLKDYNITKHYNSKHKEEYKKILCWRSEKRESGGFKEA